MAQRRLAIPSLAALAALLALLGSAGPAPAGRPGQATVGVGPATFVPGEVVVKLRGQRFGHAVELPRGVGVRAAVRRLREDPRVLYAAPNHIATASALPNDTGTPPGRPGRPGNWVRKQWNFLPCGPDCGGPSLRSSGRQAGGGIDAVGAWRNVRRAGRGGAAGVTVAVLDTGVAYRNLGRRFRRSPDFGARQFVPGRDFVKDDPLPLDENGHGTHVAGTIGERTGNRLAVTGLAYGAKLMPVRVLNRIGNGQSDDIARAIRFAARHGADVISMSFNFSCSATVPPVVEAIRYAHRRGAVLIASIGNWDSLFGDDPRDCVQMPASAPHVIGVGGTTESGCLGSYSRRGPDVDLVAPGGGSGDAGCADHRPIFQLTFSGSGFKRFGLPRGYVGTSMAAAHVAGSAALVIASRVLGAHPHPAEVEHRLEETARDLGPPGEDVSFGAGLIDAGAATDPGR